jgi:opacity protein-like surface antigen
MKLAVLFFALAGAFGHGLEAAEVPALDSIQVSAPRFKSIPNFAFELGFHKAAYPDYDWTEGRGATSSASANSYRLAFEYLPLNPDYGRLGLELGFAYQRFRDYPMNANRKDDLEAMPLSLGLKYGFTYFENQWFMPYGKVGAVGTWFRQTSDSTPEIRSQFGWGWEWALGVGLLLDNVDKRTAHTFEQEIGVKNTFATIEYAEVKPLSWAGLSPKHEALRFALRFEF